ncbi:MAG: hypothetical protein IT328_21105 [Caldilineaceae bacterium]|nr:hypothetical protein [Caldilineaceae bacterium]
MEPTKTSSDFLEAWGSCFKEHIQDIFNTLFSDASSGLGMAFAYLFEKLWGNASEFPAIIETQEDAEIIHLLTLELEFFCNYSPTTVSGTANDHYFALEKAKVIVASMLALLDFRPDQQKYRRYLHILHELLGLAQ